MSAKKPVLIFIIFFILVISIFFHNSIFGKQVLIPAHLLKFCYPWRTESEAQKVTNWIGADVIFALYPINVYTHRSMQEKTIPKWNPYNFCGTPFFANSAVAFFAPFNVLDFFLKQENCFTVKIILYVFLSCLFMALLVWKLTKNIFSALLSGLIYGFNGVFISDIYDPTYSGFILWLPCLFLFLIGDVERHHYFYGVAAGLIIAMQILSGAGFGTLLVDTIVIILAFGIYFSIAKKKEERSFVFFRSPLFTAIFSIGLGMLLSAVQLLPLIEAVNYSHRREIFFTPRPFYTLPATLINLLFPHFWGGLDQTSRWGHYLYYYLFKAPPSCMLFSVYSGVLSIFLFLLIVGRKGNNRYCIFFSWLTIAGFFFSCLYPLFVPVLRFIPLLNKVHNHERALYLYVFSLSVVSGMGMASLIQGNISLARINRIKKSLVAILLLSIFLTAVINITLAGSREKLVAKGKAYVKKNYGGNYLKTKPLDYYERLVEDIITKVSNNFSFGNILYWRSLVCLSATLGLFTYFVKKERNKIKLAWASVIFVLLDLFSYDLNLISYVKPGEAYTSTPAIELLQKKSQQNYSRVIGLWQPKMFGYGWTANQLALEILPSSSSSIFKLYDARGYSNLFPQNYYKFFKALYKQDYITAVMFPDFNQRVFDLLSVRYILTAPGFELSHHSLDLIYDNEVRIYENKNALPRVFLAPEIKRVESEEETLKILALPDVDPHRLVLVMGYDQALIFKAPAMLASKVSITDYQADRITLEAELKDEGPLVLTDTYFPGWKAFIDGKETRIYRANYIHRMIVVPKGVHSVEFIYHPLSFKMGAFISMVAFTGCGIFLLILFKH